MQTIFQGVPLSKEAQEKQLTWQEFLPKIKSSTESRLDLVANFAFVICTTCKGSSLDNKSPATAKLTNGQGKHGSIYRGLCLCLLIL